MKKIFFLITLTIFLILTTNTLAQGVTLQNPLVGTNNFPELLTKIGNYIARIVGALAVIMFVWAGILYLTVGANPGNIQKANKAVLYAVIGLAIALSGAGLIALVKTIITGP